jgi:hypothetical protein
LRAAEGAAERLAGDERAEVAAAMAAAVAGSGDDRARLWALLAAAPLLAGLPPPPSAKASAAVEATLAVPS